MNRQELLKRVGSVEQVGGIREFTFNSGKERGTLPHFLVWKMLGESEYVVGLEPRTSSKGGENIAKNNEYVQVKPFEEYKTNLKFSFKTL